MLELGSGTGVVGLSAALLGAHIAMTDLPEALPALAANLERNRAAILAAGGAAAAYAWDWRDASAGAAAAGSAAFPVLLPVVAATPVPGAASGLPAAAGSGEAGVVAGAGEAGLILGADLVYAPHQAGPLAAALRAAAAAHPRAVLLLAHKHRAEATDVALLRALAEAGFSAERERCVAPPPPPPPPHQSSPAATAAVAGATSEGGVSAPGVACLCHRESAVDAGAAAAEHYAKLLIKHPTVSVYRLSHSATSAI